MDTATPVPPSWIHKGQTDRPDWMKPYLIGTPEPNGSFLIRTKLGQSRVHRRMMVFLFDGHCYICDPSEAKAMLAGLIDAATVEPPRGPIQPGSGRPKAAPERPPAPKQANVGKSHKWPAPIGMPPSIENRHPSELNIDDSYQRSIDTGPSRSLIKRIARGWDWRKCMPLLVSKRGDGSLWVIDGQHRLAGAKLRGDIPYLPCCVAVYSGVGDEAAMFVEMNRERRQMNRLDDFHAAQAGGDPVALSVAKIIESVGFTVSRHTGSGSWAPGEVAFTSAIAKAKRRHGDEIAAEALQLMAEAFGDQKLVAGSPMFAATVAILSNRPDSYSRERLLKALKTFDMAGWASFLSDARGGSDRQTALREMLLAAYADAGGASQ